MNNNFVVLCGKSGCGKSTIAEELYKQYGLSSVISYTTRPPRTPNENNHIFITKEEFDELTDIVAYTEFNGYEYCATQEQVDENFVYTLDPYGIETFDEWYYGDKNPIVIFIDCDSTLLFNRMVQRDGFYKALEREKNDMIEFKQAKYMADYIVTNNDGELQNAVEQIYNIWRNS